MTNTVSMTKGEVVELTKNLAPTLNECFVAAGWDVKKDGPTMDLDLAAFYLGEDGKIVDGNGGYFVFYGNKASSDGSAVHGGDNLTGAGEGDDEKIDFKLKEVSASVSSIVLVTSIYEATKKNQSLENLDNAFIRLVNKDDGAELCKYELKGAAVESKGVSFYLGKLVRKDGEWSFVALGDASNEELGAIATSYGLTVASTARAA